MKISGQRFTSSISSSGWRKATARRCLTASSIASSLGFAILAPAGTRHNIINGSSGSMKLYTLYAPPNHRDGVVHATKADAEADKEHFDGTATE